MSIVLFRYLSLKTFREVAIFFEPGIDTHVYPDNLRIQWSLIPTITFVIDVLCCEISFSVLDYNYIDHDDIRTALPF